ncbi:Mu-like prophage major head subunit gpT family protein [Citrobacter farmeri]|uniref:Mu-like prophage major head subunit gpT family protein n=1 Tax=Citrobacter farmeri TaxID=67824 RepID=UPI001922EF3A|nr:Mu-like prophage major head subunit gpT family protein [Citrobacter farmeri]MBJ8744035.1 Mu-like prophage major head subunit gpT family protein [Citrobacter farmeri]MBJ8758150.1 Mu-like prophage major head subunit gpT family protein [Citrobacter farmeri]
MIVTPASIKALMTSFRKDFQGGLDGAPSQYQKIAMTVPSSSKSNTYGWLGNAPQLREWVGARVVKQMAAHGYVIDNKTYEGTVGISRDDFEDDNLGVYSPLFAELGRSAAVQPDELIFALLKDGFNQACYDGQNFFDTDHPVYASADGTGAATSVANVFQQSAEWTGAPWYLLDCSRVIKPLIFQDRRKVELVTKTRIDDDHVFTDNEFLFGASCRRAVGFGFWQMAFAMNADLTLDNLWTGWTSMRGFKADGGRPMGIKPTHLVVPPSLEKAAVQLLERELIAGQNGTVSNEMAGKLELVVADYL